MNYDKLSRSLRYYYEKGIMQKVAGKNQRLDLLHLIIDNTQRRRDFIKFLGLFGHFSIFLKSLKYSKNGITSSFRPLHSPDFKLWQSCTKRAMSQTTQLDHIFSIFKHLFVLKITDYLFIDSFYVVQVNVMCTNSCSSQTCCSAWPATSPRIYSMPNIWKNFAKIHGQTAPPLTPVKLWRPCAMVSIFRATSVAERSKRLLKHLVAINCWSMGSTIMTKVQPTRSNSRLPIVTALTAVIRASLQTPKIMYNLTTILMYENVTITGLCIKKSILKKSKYCEFLLFCLLC